jgi:HlyD family secretion protein
MKTKLKPGRLALIAAAALLAGCQPKADETKSALAGALTATAKLGPLVITVHGSGDIRSMDSVKIAPAIKRPSAVSYLIADGSIVSSNDVLAQFNTDDIDQRIKNHELALTDAEGKLLAAQTGLEIQLMDNKSAITLAEQDLSAAKLGLQKFIEGDEPMDRRNAEVKAQTAESEYTRKQRGYEALRGLLKDGFVTEDEVDEERVKLETAKLAMESAQIERKLLENYTSPLQKAAAEAALDKAKTQIEKALKQNAALLLAKTQAVESAQRAVELARSDLKSKNDERLALEIRAPLAGIIMYGNPDEAWRRSEIQVGATFQPGQILMTIPNRSVMEAVINIPEADIQNVKTGQPAEITVEALANRTFRGEVFKVAEVANSGGWWSGDVKVFRVEITLKYTKELRPGFSCDAEIVVDTIPQALYLPVQAVFRDGDKFFVYPAHFLPGKRQEVKIGRASVQYVEILEGIKPGDKVLLNPPEKPSTPSPS